MNKSQLVAKVAEKAGLTKKDAEKAVNGLFASVQEALVAGDKVQMIGFGTFEVKARAARTGRNPQTGEEIEIAASKNPAFKAGKALKDAVNPKKGAAAAKKDKKAKKGKKK
ncbi:HU family DNA-binding protein [Anaerovibrio sp.]|uniref:HU family DNA-binding protein n=1 Tax=Anaerovibrio sp. TaxID=1872532 RepID=UPI00388D529B